MSEENMTMDDLSKAVDESFETFKDEGAANWEQINQYLAEKTVLTVTVEEVVNKGVVTHLEGIRGFIPAQSRQFAPDLRSVQVSRIAQ